MRLSEHFTLDEFTRSQTAARLGIPNEPTPEDINRMRALCETILEPLRERVGRPIMITSGYRSPKLNRAIGGSPRSQHCRGEAADIVIPGMSPLDVCHALVGLPFDQAIHEFGRWCHVSYARHPRGERLTAVHDPNIGVRYMTGWREI